MSIYDNLAPFWRMGSKIGGLNRALNTYIGRLVIPLNKKPKILEVGCGTGIISFALLNKFKDANILATDKNKTMLRSTSTIALKKKLNIKQLRLGQSDINTPDRVRLLNNGMITLLPEAFDMIVAGAVLEHSELHHALPALLDLLKPGGYFLIISMNDTFFGKLYGHIYQFKPIPKEIISLLKEYNCTPTIIPLDNREFPVNLRRVGLLAKKSVR